MTMNQTCQKFSLLFWLITVFCSIFFAELKLIKGYFGSSKKNQRVRTRFHGVILLVYKFKSSRERPAIEKFSDNKQNICRYFNNQIFCKNTPINFIFTMCCKWFQFVLTQPFSRTSNKN